MSEPLKPIVWTIAGSDSGGGAGIQADLKTFQGLGVHGCSVITSVTAQNTRGVQNLEHVSAGMISAQLFALEDDLKPAALKLGMLGSAEGVQAIADFLDTAKTFVVCDPVLAATSGKHLLDHAAFDAFRDELLPYVNLLTPNLHEAAALLSRRIESTAAMEEAAHELLKFGVKSVLLKGGHADWNGPAQDFWTNGKDSAWLTSPRIETAHTHGGGCTLSAAITAGIALGLDELSAITLAKAYVNQGLRGAVPVGGGRNPLAHGGWPHEPQDLPWISKDWNSARLKFPEAGKLPPLYVVVDRAEWIAKLLPLGAKLVQLRAKDLSGAELEAEVKRAVELGRQFDAQVYINDAWELALKHGAYGVHLGQDDMPTADLAAIQKAGLRLGLSTHNYAEVARAMSVIPSYLAIGTLFESPSKSFEHRPLGLENFRKMRPLVGVPVVAIGGITLERAPEVFAAGADCCAVISDVTKADDVAARVAAWLGQGKKTTDSH
jgi:hydroxymethylpyrimidine kinase / phosphomethylpyrimidine kinase / thiamine-phosphate diphosphorylase